MPFYLLRFYVKFTGDHCTTWLNFLVLSYVGADSRPLSDVARL
jgi:hypothetical protein